MNHQGGPERPQDTPDIDISPGQWDIVHDILQRHVPGHEVWAFGSRARRRVKPYSDLDLACHLFGYKAARLSKLVVD